MKIQISPLLGYERHFWPCPELLQAILAWSMDPRVTGPDPETNKYEYVPAIGFNTSQAARNHVCDLFLDNGDCDYLIMIDNDMPPTHPETGQLVNVISMACMGLPIVAAPSIILRHDNWHLNGYYHDYENGWRAMALEEMEKPKVDRLVQTEWGPVVKVDAAGFGCMAIRGDVVEKVRASGVDFLDSGCLRTTEAGLVDQKYAKGVTVTRHRTPRGDTYAGEDLLFCRRAMELGYQTYIAPGCLMGHYHTIDLARMPKTRYSLQYPDYGLTHPHPQPDDWSISVELANYLRQLVYEIKPQQTVELGSGISTFVLAEEAMRLDCGLVLSLEENKTQAGRINGLLQKGGLWSASVRHVPLDESGFYGDTPAMTLDHRIDILLVDGPSGQHESRGQASCMFDLLNDGAYVILDDTHRPYESNVVEDWVTNHGLNIVTVIKDSGGRTSTVLRKLAK